MTAPPARRLRAVCPGPEENPGPVSSLRLISALAAHGRVASATGLGPSGAEHELRLPGIGGRYLAGIAAHATDRGSAPD